MRKAVQWRCLLSDFGRGYRRSVATKQHLNSRERPQRSFIKVYAVARLRAAATGGREPAREGAVSDGRPEGARVNREAGEV